MSKIKMKEAVDDGIGSTVHATVYDGRFVNCCSTHGFKTKPGDVTRYTGKLLHINHKADPATCTVLVPRQGKRSRVLQVNVDDIVLAKKQTRKAAF